MRIVAAGQSDIGRVRDHNEDYYVIAPEIGLYVVCDGVGGQDSGEVASKEAAEEVKRFLEANRPPAASEESPRAFDKLTDLVERAVQAACKRVHDAAGPNAGLSRMATTMTLLLVAGNKAAMGHVGDSRLYLHRRGKLHQLSEDHTYANELKKRGKMGQELTKDHPLGNVIMRVLGQAGTVQVDTLAFDCLPGDTYLLCSDGLSRYMENTAELEEMLGVEDVKSMPAALIQLANQRGGKDNITAVLVRAESEAETEEEDLVRSEDVTLRFNTMKFVYLFQYLTHQELLRVLSASESRNLDPGQVVIREGETDDCLYVAVDGRLMVSRGGRPVAELERGSHFGEMALLNLRPRSATVQAVEPSRVLVITRSRLNELIRQEPPLGVKLLWCFAQVLSSRLDDTTEQLFRAPRADPTLVDLPFPRT